MSEHSQGEWPEKVKEAIKQLRHPPSEEEILKIKANLRGQAPAAEKEDEQ